MKKLVKVSRTNFINILMSFILILSLSPGIALGAEPAGGGGARALLWSLAITGSFVPPGAIGAETDVITAQIDTAALTGEDPLDIPNPPAKPEPPELDLYFLIGNAKKQIEARPLADPSPNTWSLRVNPKTDTSVPATITLTWDRTSVPALYYLTLDDRPNGGQLVNLRKANSYPYIQTTDTHRSMTLTAQINQLPVVSAVSPNGGENIAGTINVTANVSDADGTVASVGFSYSATGAAPWTPIGSDTSAPYSVIWNTAGLAEVTTYRIRAVATDDRAMEGERISAANFTVDNRTPDTPSLAAPTSGTTINATTTLNWSAVVATSGVTYELWVDNNSDFSSPEVIATTAVNTYNFSVAGRADGTYNWRVRAVNGANLKSDWSSSRTFILDATVSTPSLTEPADGARINNTRPTLRWSTVTDPSTPVTYDLQVAATITFAPTSVATTVTVTSYELAPGEALAAGIYFWRVRARDNLGNIGSYSSMRSFIVDLTAPLAPTPLLAPINTATSVALMSTFRWTAVTDPSGVTYDLRIGTDANLSDLVVTKTGLPTSTYTLSSTEALSPNSTYFWSARAVDGAGNPGSLVTPAFSFSTISNRSPSVSVTSPLAGQYVAGTIGVGADASDPDGTVTRVSFSYGVSPWTSWTAIGSDLSSPYSATWNTVGLPDGGQYKILVTATDDLGASSQAESAIFIVDNNPPGRPTLLTPASGAHTNSTRPTVTWSAVVDFSGIRYDLQIDNNTDFSSPEYSTVGLTATIHVPSAVAEGTYSWRVRAKEAAGALREGEWASPIFTFIIDTTAPASPTLVSPTHGSATNRTMPTFTWQVVTDVSPPVTYELGIDDSPAFTSHELNIATTATTYTLTALEALATGNWYWAVRATDNVGNIGSYSATRAFLLDTDAPSTGPTLLTPEDEAANVPLKPTFTWSPVIDPSGVTYTLEIDNTSSLFPSPEVTITGIAATTYTLTTALATGTYFWSVRAVDGAGNIGPRAEWPQGKFKFTTMDNKAPVVVPTIPTFGQIVHEGSINVAATVIDPDGSIARVDFSYSTSPWATWRTIGQGILTAANTYTAAWDTSGLPDSDTYRVRVIAEDNRGAQSTSDTGNFIIDNNAPGRPTLLTPANNSNTNATPTFTWSEVTDFSGVRYAFQIDNDSDFSSPEYSTSGLTAATHTPAVILTEGINYWRVMAKEPAGALRDGAWASPTFSFRFNITPPTVPTLLTPADNSARNFATLTFTWSAITDLSAPVTYDFQLASTITFTAFVADITGLASPNYTLAAGAKAEIPHYWRVRARDNADNIGAWATPAFTLTFDATAPVAPALSTPLNNAQIQLLRTPFAWIGVSDPSGVTYTLTVDDTADLSSPVQRITGLTATSYTLVSALAASTTHYWTVSATDGASNAGAQAATFTFRTMPNESPRIITTPPPSAFISATLTLRAAASDSDGTIASVAFLYSTDAGATWRDIGPASFSAAEGFWSLSWNTSGLVATAYLIRSVAEDDLGTQATFQLAPVTIDNTPPVVSLTAPNGGEFLVGGSTVPITWTATDAFMAANPISLHYSTDGGTTYPNLIAAGEANDGSFTWTVPSIDSATVRVRVTAIDNAGNSASDASDANFTIDSIIPAVSVTFPNGGEFLKGGGSVNITWTATDANMADTPISLHYSTDGGATYPNLIATGVANVGSFAWTVPSIDSSTIRVRVTAIDRAGHSGSDASDANFTIDSTNPSVTLTRPNGGESWAGGIPHTITWTATDANMAANPITLAYATDGATWSQIATNEVNDGSFIWTTPLIISTTVRVRVTAIDKAGNSASDTSDADFSITGPADILAYYRGLGADLNKVETADLLRAADDWLANITPAGFTSPITTAQLLALADEWLITP